MKSLRPRRFFSGAIFATAFSVTPCTAAESVSNLLPDSLAFGLDRLHWGMTTSEAEQLFPKLELKLVDIAPFNAPPDWGPTLRGTDIYQWSDCRLRLALSFYKDRLDNVSVCESKSQHPFAANISNRS
jgi:hypothetical protein